MFRQLSHGTLGINFFQRKFSAKIFDRAYPHRLQMSEAEKAGVAARVAKAAARTKRRENPPASAHAMSKRARA